MSVRLRGQPERTYDYNKLKQHYQVRHQVPKGVSGWETVSDKGSVVVGISQFDFFLRPQSARKAYFLDFGHTSKYNLWGSLLQSALDHPTLVAAEAVAGAIEIFQRIRRIDREINNLYIATECENIERYLGRGETVEAVFRPYICPAQLARALRSVRKTINGLKASGCTVNFWSVE